MNHSVRRHLRLAIRTYDETIRKFIPGYAAMIETAAAETARCAPGLVVDLGAGTGALSEAVLEHSAVGSLEAVDIDPEMLDQARSRLARFGKRVRFSERSFDAPLPRCDAVTASLALHHVPTMDGKRALYRRIAAALHPGGVFANADVTMPADGPARDAGYRAWAGHMIGSGIAEEQAWRHFAEWAEEDVYFPLEAELAAMEDAGLRAECRWRDGPSTVLVGTAD